MMRRIAQIAMTAALVGGAASAFAADHTNPTVVELFQSQGCSSCPPADLVLNQLADRPDVLALNFSVTYWDQLGWKDSFAQPAFTARQWDYANARHRGEVSTPQMLVNGRGVLVGNRLVDAQAAIARFDRGSDSVAIGLADNRVRIGKGSVPGATLWLVAFDPRTIPVAIGAGENAGRTIPHRNIVRSLTAIGKTTAAGGTFDLPPRAPAYRYALLVQAGAGGPILAAPALAVDRLAKATFTPHRPGMCYSPTASFVSSALIATVGVATLRHVSSPRTLLFAATPMLFALHQFTEGLVWLGMQGRIGPIGRDHVAFLFTLYAQGILPFLMPLAVTLMEPAGWRQKVMIGLTAIGAVAAAWDAYGLIFLPLQVVVDHNAIAYRNEMTASLAISLLYILASCGSLLLSSFRVVRWYGILNIIALSIVQLVRAYAFASVWCFYAALMSIMLYWQFRRGHFERTAAA